MTYSLYRAFVIQAKVKSSKQPIAGSFEVPGAGEVVVTVDNGFSYLRSKHLLDLRIVVDNDTDTPYGTDPQVGSFAAKLTSMLELFAWRACCV